MPTLLDEFVIKLQLDSRGFQRDAQATQQSMQQTGTAAVRQSGQIEDSLKKTQIETQKRFKQVEEVGRQVTTGFTRLRAEVGGLLATIAGAYGLEFDFRRYRNDRESDIYQGWTGGYYVVQSIHCDRWKR